MADITKVMKDANTTCEFTKKVNIFDAILNTKIA